MLLDQGQELVLPGTDDGLHLLAVLDEVEGRHRLDLVGRGDILLKQGKQHQYTNGGGTGAYPYWSGKLCSPSVHPRPPSGRQPE